MSDQDDVFLQSSPEPDLFIYPSQVHPVVTDAITADLFGDGIVTYALAVEATREVTADGAGVVTGTIGGSLVRSATGVGVVDFSYVLTPDVPPTPGGGPGGNPYPTRLRPTELDRCEDPEDCPNPDDEELALLLVLGVL